MNDYSRQWPGYTSRKRQIINAVLEELYVMHEEMIEQALEQSDFRESTEIINYIKAL